MRVKSKDHPTGCTVTRVYAAKEAAEQYALLYKKEYPEADVWVSEKLGYESRP